MPIAKFIHLRTQSSYSLLESTIKIGQLVKLAEKSYMPAIALTDKINLFGALEFATSAVKLGIQPIHGVLVNVPYFDSKHQQNFAELVLIAKDREGYENLLYLVSSLYIKNSRSPVEHITWDDLLKHNKGLIILSGHIKGIIGQMLLKNQVDIAKAYANKLLEIFGDNFYFEIMRHQMISEQMIESQYLALASQLNIPLVATNEVLFAEANMHDDHDTLLCVAKGVLKSENNRPKVSHECYFKSPEQMEVLFADLHSAISNTLEIAQRCSFMAETHPPMLPNFVVQGQDEKEVLRKTAYKGLGQRLKVKSAVGQCDYQSTDEDYYNRLEYELAVICDMNFAGYFLIVADFVKWSKEQKISVGPGRGSGVGSIVAWSLSITDTDPIRFGLLFERFLNPERVSIPDFDIDFCQERRVEVIEYVTNRYGSSRVAHIITFGSMQAKAVIKDVARVLGLRFELANYVTELVPFNAVHPVTLEQAVEQVAELKQAAKGVELYNLKLREYEDPEEIAQLIQKTIKTALVLEGMQRHVSIHAAGIVIAAKDLIKTVPLYKSANEETILIQYSMKYAELAGLVKFDFLGLQTLTVIANCCKLLQKRGNNIDPSNLPLDDEPTYQLLTQGKTNGVFQFEGSGIKDNLRKLKPDRIEDIMALTSLYRPGPMDNIHIYIACKFGVRQPDYLHPILEGVLKETYGVMIYQEQVMEIARILAGYTLGQADLLRRAMGKKIKAEMDEQEKIFIRGAVNNGVVSSIARDIFTAVAKFAGYGFNKSHAAAYALISYQTAYLKANYTIEFLVACLNLELNDSHKINTFLTESRQFNIPLIKPDINVSEGHFTIQDARIPSIVFAFGAIKNISPEVGEAIALERRKSGKFTDIFNFIERLQVKIINKKVLESLIQAGGFDSIEANRNKLFVNVDKLLSHSALKHHEHSSNQMSFLGPDYDSILSDANDWSACEKANREFDVTGVFLSCHPLNQYIDFLNQAHVYNSRSLSDLSNGVHQLKIAGVIQKKDNRMSDRGIFVTLTLSDCYNNFDVTIFNEQVLKEYANLLTLKTAVVLHCEALKDEGSIRLVVNKVISVTDFIKSYTHTLQLYVANSEVLLGITRLLQSKQNLSQSNAIIFLIFPVSGSFIAKVKLPEIFCLEALDFQYLAQFNYDS